MGKKHKKHKTEWRSSYEDYTDKPLEKPLKLVLKVGGSEVTELSGSGHDSSYYDDRSDHERERHKEKKKKKKKKSEKEKHLDDEERRKRKEEKKRKREKEHCDTEGEADDFDPGKKVEVEPPPDRPVRACRTQPDFKLMCDNAMTYNRPDTVYYKLAKKLLHAGFKMMSKQAALLGSEDAAAEEPAPEVVPVQVETAKKSKRPSREVISCMFEPEGNACSLTDSTAEEHVLALVEHAADEARDRISRLLPGSKLQPRQCRSGAFVPRGSSSGARAAVLTGRWYLLAMSPGREGRAPGTSRAGPSLTGVMCSVWTPAVGSRRLGVDLRHWIEAEPTRLLHCLCLVEASVGISAVVEVTGRPSADGLRRTSLQMGYLKKNGDGSLLYSVVNVAEPDADEEETHPVDLSSLSSKLLPGFTTLGFKDERRSRVTFLSSASTALSMHNNSVFGDLKSDETELLYSAYGDETGVQCALSLQEFVKDAGSYSKKMVDDLLDQITGGDHSRMLFQLRQRRNVPVKPPDEVKAGDSLGDGSSVLDFMSMKSYSDVSLDISILSSLGKVKKELDHDDNHLNLDETTKLLQDLHEAQAERGGSRPSSNLSSLSNASDRDHPHLGSPSRLSVGEQPDVTHDPYEFLQSPEPATSTKG
ncbi:bromodomain-containing protein 9 isoform X5 [Equus quagga]|uniref:bromodomain-containing protein 9 isoform X5 n=1 Tax=Equus quagga TaxID=89248 RepID=UPI001EE342DE|nr:bromodomain-containing protein 9 isoform X5 [Equus quagga]